MSIFPLYINDISFASSMDISVEKLLTPVLDAIQAIREAKRIREDFTIYGDTTLSKVCFGKDYHSLSEVLGGDNYKDEWRFISNLDQKNPWGARTQTLVSSESTKVTYVLYQGCTAPAMLWADRNSSAILSFAIENDWNAAFINAELLEMSSCCPTKRVIKVNNLSKPEHAEIHRQLIYNYDQDFLNSSLIFVGRGFAIRMYSNDHNPPHFHVMAAGDTDNELARINIKTMDTLDSSPYFISTIRKEVIKWASNKMEALLGCWQARLEHRPTPRLDCNDD